VLCAKFPNSLLGPSSFGNLLGSVVLLTEGLVNSLLKNVN
jgi:hypothetical protein